MAAQKTPAISHVELFRALCHPSLSDTLRLNGIAPYVVEGTPAADRDLRMVWSGGRKGAWAIPVSVTGFRAAWIGSAGHFTISPASGEALPASGEAHKYDGDAHIGSGNVKKRDGDQDKASGDANTCAGEMLTGSGASDKYAGEPRKSAGESDMASGGQRT